MIVIVENGHQMPRDLQRGFWQEFYQAVDAGQVHGNVVEVWIHPTSAEAIMECGRRFNFWAKIPPERRITLGHPGPWAIQEFVLHE